ncbi:GIY-YIG nuclease family protein [Patescibacteria group bacterium]|nr:GIY-YIG nuclease family protein [Patescibacteria group bacterium]
MIHVYIIQSLKDKGYYTGISNNIENRLDKHNKGGVGSTKSRGPFKLVYKEECIDYKMARLREKEIKLYKGGNSFKKLIKS